MADLAAAAIWTLITVTNAGAVHQESGFPSKAVCEDAISIAKTGLTVAEAKERADRAREEERRKREKWEAENPWRDPVTDAEKKEVLSRKGPNGTCSPSIRSSGYEISEQCQIRGTRRDLVFSTIGLATNASDNEIKYARCVLTIPEAKP